MKKDFPGKDDLAKKVSRKIDAWKSLSYTKKSNMTDFWARTSQKKISSKKQKESRNRDNEAEVCVINANEPSFTSTDKLLSSPTPSSTSWRIRFPHLQ